MSNQRTNKLTVYLIKEDIDENDIFKNGSNLASEEIEDIGCLFYTDSRRYEPDWLKHFFKNSIDNKVNGNKFKIYSATARAVLIVSVDNRQFAITFGYGRTLLNPGVWEERFGLKVTLNVSAPDELRKITKKNLNYNPKLSMEQMTKDGPIFDFGVDIEQDMVEGITAKTNIEGFGRTVTGKDSISMSVKIDISNIKEFLNKCYKIYMNGSYKENFGWIDQMLEIRDRKLIDSLNYKLIEKMRNNKLEQLWMAIPEIITWEDVLDFKYKTHSFGDDISIKSYFEFLTEEDKMNLSIETLKKHNINCISAKTGKVKLSWKIYNCLYCEINEAKQIYILSNGKWFKIESEYAEKVINNYNKFRSQTSSLKLPDCEVDEHEDVYNKRVSKDVPGACCMDRKLIYFGGIRQKLEFCDILTSDKKIIHVKKYGSSSVLSHLFNQGKVSGELFRYDSDFRKILNKKLPPNYKLNNYQNDPDPSQYEIIFAVISKSKGDLEIPFFSKITMNHAVKYLSRCGYKVSLLKVNTRSVDK